MLTRLDINGYIKLMAPLIVMLFTK